ncbi:MAG: hypothetical protein AB7T19_04845 [Planctomycetota bacterium]
MPVSRTSLVSLTIAALTNALFGQQVTWAEGGSPLSRDVLTLAESALGAAPRVVLQAVEFLPIEITCRTAQQSLRDDVARRVVRQGLARVVLPDGGSLFRYRRAQAGHYGYLHLAPDGTARSVIELPAGGGADPFLGRVAVSPDGRFATVPNLNGDRHYILRLDGNVFASTGTSSRVVTLSAFHEDWSHSAGRDVYWFVTDDDRVWRCAYADGAIPIDITPPGPIGARAKPEFAVASDGNSAVFLRGARPDFEMFLTRATGASIRIPVSPSKFEEPGYLPDVDFGPRLLLTDDGTSLLYVDAGIRDEGFVRDLTGLRSETHWTGDHNFQPYIGVIVFPHVVDGVFFAGIGDPGRFDLFAASAGVRFTSNLTRTGSMAPPFIEGNLIVTANSSTRAGVVLSALAPSAGGPSRVWRFDGGSPTPLGGNLARSMVRGANADGGAIADYLLPSAAGDQLIDGQDGLPLLTVPAGVRMTTSAVAPNGAYRVLLADGAGSRALVVMLPGSLLGFAANGVEDVAVQRSGGFVFEGPSLTILATTGLRVHTSAASNRLLLSGQGVDGF